MRVVVYSTKPYDRRFLDGANAGAGHELVYLESRLMPETARSASGAQAICAFVNDELGADVLAALAGLGARLVALRCAGFNNVDLAAARDLGIIVARVPEYSPHAVAEHAVALILALNRKIHRASRPARYAPTKGAHTAPTPAGRFAGGASNRDNANETRGRNPRGVAARRPYRVQ